MRALGEVTDGAARLLWRRQGGGWRLNALGVEDGAAAAEQVHGWIGRMAGAWDWNGLDDATVDPAGWTAGAKGSQGLTAELWAAIGSDGCVRRNGRIQTSRLEYAQGGGHQHWLASLRGAVRRVASGDVAPGDLGRVLWGEWRHGDQGLVCRWDWRCERDHALMAADPAGSAMVMHQDYAATALAAIGLASLPTAPARPG